MKNRGFRIKIFQDGANLNEMLKSYSEGWVQGFTTNPTLMRQAGVLDYETFAREAVKRIPDLPISFEVFADDFDLMYQQARKIHSWGKWVYVKIPIMNAKGQLSDRLIVKLLKNGVKINVTAVMTAQQILSLRPALKCDTPAMVSIFAGRIADTGRDPVPIIKQGVQLLKGYPQVELLWASPREILNVYQAEACGCHIITLPSELIKKISMNGMNLNELSRQTVRMFYEDALKSNFDIKV